MIRIGDFSRLNQVSIKTLRYYDKLGLLVPSHVDESTGYRYYSVEQITRLNRILAFKEIGFSLNEITMALDTNLTPEMLVNLLEAKKISINTLIEMERSKVSRIEAFIKILIEEVNPMKNQVVLKETPALKAASLRDTVANYSAQGVLWNELFQYIESKNIKVLVPCIAIYHDEGYKDQDVDIEVVAAVTEYGTETNRIKFKELPAVKEMACLIHEGSYEKLISSYNVISKWIAENHYDITGPGRECHLKGPWNEPNPDQWVTEIQLPVSKKAI